MCMHRKYPSLSHPWRLQRGLQRYTACNKVMGTQGPLQTVQILCPIPLLQVGSCSVSCLLERLVACVPLLTRMVWVGHMTKHWPIGCLGNHSGWFRERSVYWVMSRMALSIGTTPLVASCGSGLVLASSEAVQEGRPEVGSVPHTGNSGILPLQGCASFKN